MSVDPAINPTAVDVKIRFLKRIKNKQNKCFEKGPPNLRLITLNKASSRGKKKIFLLETWKREPDIDPMELLEQCGQQDLGLEDSTDHHRAGSSPRGRESLWPDVPPLFYGNRREGQRGI